MMQGEDVNACVSRRRKWHVGRRTGKERATRRGQLEKETVAVQWREVERGDVVGSPGEGELPKL